MTNPSKLFPLFVTDDLAASKRFYVEGLRWTITHEADCYLQVRQGSEDGPELAFMKPQGVPVLGSMPAFSGQGVIVSVPVDDADAHWAELRARGLSPLGEPSDKPWNWRSYLIRDPSGIVLDFFHTLAADVAKTG